MTTKDVSTGTKFKVGIFTVLGLLLAGLVSVLVNDKPYWWRPCQLVRINIEDATGLKTKSPVRSLGLQVGYLASVDLAETHVTLGICITAPVEVLPSTRAYIRGEGFLGDKFVELKPLRYVGRDGGGSSSSSNIKPAENSRIEVIPVHPEVSGGEGEKSSKSLRSYLQKLDQWLMPSAYAEESPAPAPGAPAEAEAAEAASPPPAAPPAKGAGTPSVRRNARGEREIPVGQGAQDVQQLVGRVDDLVKEMTGVANNLRQSINPEDMRKLMKQLNTTLESASKTLSPEGGLNQTAQRALGKLEDAIEQLRDMLTRMNQGKGSIGMLVNDPSYAEELKEAIKNVNKLLSKAGGIRFVVDVGAQKIRGYDGGRGYFRLQVWPRPDRYYLLGISVDPRGKRTVTKSTTVAGGVTAVTETTTIEETGLILTGMLGKVFYDRFDLSVGALFGDGTLSTAVRLGPEGDFDRFRLQNDVYVRSGENGVNNRVTFLVRPYSGLYFDVGLDGVHNTPNNNLPFFFGGGVSFDDDDIKVLFAFF